MRGRNKGSLWSDAFITCRDLARRRRRSASPTRPAAYGARVKPATPRPLHSEPPGGKRSRGARGTASEALGRSAGGGALSTRRAETPSERRGSVRPRGKSPFPPAGRVRGHHPALGLLAGPSRHRVRRSGLVTMLAGGPHSSGHGQASLGEVASMSGRPGRGFA